MDKKFDMNQIINDAERIGTIGSPSSTKELTLDILGSSVEKKLVGELAFFKFMQDSKEHYALGQITDVKLRNVWLEDPTMRSLARQRGQVNPISGQQDTHLGIMTISAVFANNGSGYEPSILGTVPQTGTFIQLADDKLINMLLYQYKKEIFYLGNVYGSKPQLPMWFKHFDSGAHGAGEAYHLGIFGKTGSGKSVLAKMILTAYSRYREMAILIIDPQGEFAKDFSDNKVTGQFILPLKDIVKKNNKDFFVMPVRKFILDRWELFEQLFCESKFFDRLTIRYPANKEPGSSVLVEELRKKNVKIHNLSNIESFEIAWDILSNNEIQKKFIADNKVRKRFSDSLANADKDEFFYQHWLPLTELFNQNRKNARTIEKALKWLFKNRSILIIDLSKEQAGNIFWNERVQALVIKRLLSGLTNTAEKFYGEGKNLNTLVVIDEAHRLAPREAPKDDVSNSLRNMLIDAVRTTRKYGLGWLFISQTLSSLHKEIINQQRISFFGFGLSMGTEFMALKEIAGGDQNALKLYQSFRDPHSSFDLKSREYSFMTIGPVSPLSFAGTTLFFTAFNDIKNFLEANKIYI